jgi:integrase
MIDFDRSLLAYVDRVLLSRDITADYGSKVRYCCRRFVVWLTYDPGVAGLDAESVNEFLIDLKNQGLRPDTVAGYRRAIILIWNEAYRARDHSEPPLRVRRVRTPREPVEAFTLDELRSLLDAASKLTGYFPNGVKRADFWTVAIHSAYATGLRRGDLLMVKWADIGADGLLSVCQSKTGYPVTVRLDSGAREARARITIDDGRLLPWPFHPNALSRQFLAIAKLAGVRPGQFRWLRRSAGSYAESEHRGDGRRLLGQRSERVFRDFYEVASITSPQPVEPPGL